MPYVSDMDGTWKEWLKLVSVARQMICKLGGFVIMRHNAIRDVEADFLRNVCKDVSVEPGLIQLTGNEELASGSNLEDNARLDISCRGFLVPLQKMFLDVRFTHPNAPSNRNRKLKPLLKTWESEKSRIQRPRSAGRACFFYLLDFCDQRRHGWVGRAISCYTGGKNDWEAELYVCGHYEIYPEEALLHQPENWLDSLERTPEETAIHVL